MNQRVIRIGAIAAAAIFVVACGDDDGTDDGSPGDGAPAAQSTSGDDNGGDDNGTDNTAEDTGDTPDGGSTVIGVEGTEFAFTPEALAAAPGELTIELTNTGAIEHDLVIEGHEDRPLVVLPGNTGSETWELDSGTYEVWCSIPGHRQAGMEATLTVE